MIIIRGIIEFTKEHRLTDDNVREIMEQIADDAVYGSFDDFPEFWRDKWTEKRKYLADVRKIEKRYDNSFDFEFSITEKILPQNPIYPQHLIGIIAGDLFNLRLPKNNPTSIIIKAIDMHPDFRNQIISSYRKDRAHTINQIRTSFKLDQYEPLLAFSLKPRFGINFKLLEEVTIGVLKAGFHLVEMDTRHLLLGDDDITRLIELSEKAANIGANQRITRFSPNITVRSPKSVEIVNRLMQNLEDPVVIKVDGGLDGFSTCQSIRELFCRTNDHTFQRTPIITSYPLLHQQLQNRIPKDFFIDLLGLSGADIIYIGGRPSLGSIDNRVLDTNEPGHIYAALSRYDNAIYNEWPMPTLAGGVYAGELHAYYELFGPNVAFFLGGAVALHTEGPIKGAELCNQIIKSAIELRVNNPTKDIIPNLKDNLILQTERAYKKPNVSDNLFRYIQPSSIISNSLQSWFERSRR